MLTLAAMPSPPNEIRKELSFSKHDFEQFEKMAKADGRKVKNWMEHQLKMLLPKSSNKKTAK